MIDMNMLGDALVALAALIGVAIVLSVVLLAAGSARKSGPAPHGGIRPELPQQPLSDSDDDRVLVLH